MKLKFIFRTLNGHDLKIRDKWNGQKMRRDYSFGIVIDSNTDDGYDVTHFTEVYLLLKSKDNPNNNLNMKKYFLNQQKKL